MIGIYLTSWSDNEIVLGGFGTALNTNGQGPLNINPGDPLIVDVLTSNGQTAHTTTAVSSQSGQNSTQNPVLLRICQHQLLLSPAKAPQPPQTSGLKLTAI